MAVTLSPLWGAGAQLFDDNGTPLAGGRIYTYDAGTTTPRATYTTISGTIANSNPIVLDAAGRVPNEVWLTDGYSYKFVLKDNQSPPVDIATYDNIVGINSSFYTVDQEIQVAGANQSVFTLTTMQYQPGTNSLSVFIDGVNQYGNPGGNAFLETSPTTVAFSAVVPEDSIVKFTTARAIDPTTFIADASNITYLPPFTSGAATNVEAKLSQYVSIKDFGAVGDGVTDDWQAIQNAYTNAKNIFWPAGTYRLETYIRVYADTQTTFDKNVIIEKASVSQPVFCNATAGNTTTTVYNGDGNISFIGPLECVVASGNTDTSLQVFGFVHARGFYIDGQGGGYIHGFSNRHAIEINACADWVVTGYKFADQTVDVADVDFAEVIQWDGAFDASRFPFAPGASDNTTNRDFEISNCIFDDIYTAYGAHHAPNYKHLRGRITNNTIIAAKAPETAERLKHLKDSIVYGTIIQGCVGRATNIRQCVNVLQDFYVISDAGSATSAIFWQTSTDCVWGPNNRIYFTGTPPAHIFEVGSIANPSTGIVINKGIVDLGTGSGNKLLADNGTNTLFAGVNISYKPFVIDSTGVSGTSAPALFIKEFGPTEGEIAVPTGENLSIGQYNAATPAYVSILEITGGKNLFLPNTGSGSGAGNILFSTPGAGIQLTTPDGTKKYNITIDNSGTVISTLVP